MCAYRNNYDMFTRIWPLWIAPVASEFSWVDDLWVGGVSGACLAGWLRHHGGFQYVAARLAGNFPHFHAKCPLLLSNLTKTGMYRQILFKLANIKCHWNPFCRSRLVTCVQTDRAILSWRSAGLGTCLKILNLHINLFREHSFHEVEEPSLNEATRLNGLYNTVM
jgi:hypothetical protein